MLSYSLTGFTHRWRNFPHRLSHLHLGLTTDPWSAVGAANSGHDPDSAELGVDWALLNLPGLGRARIEGVVVDEWRGALARVPDAGRVIGRVDTGVPVAQGAVQPFLLRWSWTPRLGGEPVAVWPVRLGLSLSVEDGGGTWMIVASTDLAHGDAPDDLKAPPERTPHQHEFLVDVGWTSAPADAAHRVTMPRRALLSPVPTVQAQVQGRAGAPHAVALLSGFGFALSEQGNEPGRYLQGITFGVNPAGWDPATGKLGLRVTAGPHAITPVNPSRVAAHVDVLVVHPTQAPLRQGATLLSVQSGGSGGKVETARRPLPALPGPVVEGTKPFGEPPAIVRMPATFAPWTHASVAGFAVRRLDPPPNHALIGYGLANSGRASKERNPLLVRAMALGDADGNRVVFVVADLWSGSRFLHERVAELTRASIGLDVDRLVLMGTHTHTGPSGFIGNDLYDFFAAHTGSFDDVVAEELAQRIAGTVREAWEKRQPARVRVDVRKAWGLSRNRSWPAFTRNPGYETWNAQGMPGGDAPAELAGRQKAVDPRVTVLSAYGTNGERLGVFATFACHNTAVGHSAPWQYDSDWTGAAASHVEASEGGVALVALSGAGDQTPLPPTRKEAYNGPDHAGQDLRRFVGEGVGNAILSTNAAGAAGSEVVRLRVGYRDWWTTDHDLADPAWNDAPKAKLADWAFGAPAMGGAEDGRSPWPLYPVFARDGMVSDRFPPSSPQHPKALALGPVQDLLDWAQASLRPAPVHGLHTIQVAGHLFATVPGEPTVWAAHQIAAALAGVEGARSVSVVGYANDYAGYFTTASEYRAQCYEGASTLYGANSTLQLAQRIAELARRPDGFPVQSRMPGFPAKVAARKATDSVGARRTADGIIAWRTWAGKLPTATPTVLVFERVDAGLVPVSLPRPPRVDRALLSVDSGTEAWVAEITLPEGTGQGRFLVSFDGATVKLGGPWPEGVTPAPKVQDLESLAALLDQAPDGGTALLEALFPSASAAEMRALIDAAVRPGLEAVWPLPTHVEVDPAALAAFVQAHPIAGQLTPEEVRSTKFQTYEDWNSYVFDSGGIGYHATGMRVARPMYLDIQDRAKALSYPTRPGEDPAQATVRLAMFADFGNGLYPTRGIARQLTDAGLPYAFHLGDVYYSGSKEEFETGFFYGDDHGGFVGPLAPVLPKTELFMLAGNHEMYSRGEFFQAAIRQKKAAFPALQRQEAEMWRLRGDGFQVVGIDSMWSTWEEHGTRIGARLGADALALLDAWLAEGLFTILLTSDHAWDRGKKRKTRLLADLEPHIRAGRVDLWMWGNVHYASLYESFQFDGVAAPGVVTACVGHGGYPFYTQERGEKLPAGVRERWADDRSRFWPLQNVRPDVGLNGWVEVTLDHPAGEWRVGLNWRDWVGREIARTRLVKPDGGALTITDMEELRESAGGLAYVPVG